MEGPGTHAILNPLEGAGRFSLERRAPSPGLEALVKRHWLVRWDLRGRPPFAQETLPYPCVNLVLGTHQPGVHGVGRRRFVADLRGAGWVVGVKFRPGAFRGLLGSDVSFLTDRSLPVGVVFGAAGERLDREVHAAASDAERLVLVEAFLRERAPPPSPGALAAGCAVDLVECDPAVARVDDLARRTGVGVRRLERLFRAHVGVSPKWVIRTFRVHEAAERVKAGAPADWAALAQELGYCDQSHFIRDFKAQVGRSPAEYAARCAEAAARPASPGARAWARAS